MSENITDGHSRCNEAVIKNWLFCNRVVEMVDGWTLTMADTEENQEAYPQQKSQRRGCGFPILRMVGLFSLSTGSVQACAFGPYPGKQTGETSLLRSMVDRVLPGRILLADRYDAGYWLLALSDLKGIDIVARAHQLRKIDFRGGMKLGSLDQIVAYDRPQRPSWMTEQEYERYPRMILIRYMKYKISQRGFRTEYQDTDADGAPAM